MNFDEQLFRGLEDAHRQRVEMFLHLQNEDDTNDQPEETYDLFKSLIENRGEQGLLTLTRFKINEFLNIFEICRISIETAIDKKGRKCKLNPCDRLLVTLTYLATGMKYSQMGNLFNIRLPLLQRAIDSTLKCISPVLTRKFVCCNQVALNNELKFKYYPDACGAIDTTLIEISKPRDRGDQKKFWSTKHHACGIKIQALVRPNGICTSFVFGYPGSMHDMNVLKTSNWINTLLSYVVSLPNGSSVTHHHQCLFDKGYTGLNNLCPEAVVTIRKPVGRDLTQEENSINNRIESDRVIVENFFGRLKSIFGILGSRFRGDKKNHLQHIISICMSLTNYYSSLHPMRQAQETNNE